MKALKQRKKYKGSETWKQGLRIKVNTLNCNNYLKKQTWLRLVNIRWFKSYYFLSVLRAQRSALSAQCSVPRSRTWKYFHAK